MIYVATFFVITGLLLREICHDVDRSELCFILGGKKSEQKLVKKDLDKTGKKKLRLTPLSSRSLEEIKTIMREVHKSYTFPSHNTVSRKSILLKPVFRIKYTQILYFSKIPIEYFHSLIRVRI